MKDNFAVPKKVKTYPVPDDLCKIIEEAFGAEELRDTYARQMFGFKKALKAATVANKKRNEFWEGVRDIYPKLNGTLTFNRFRKVVWQEPAETK